MKYFMNGKEIDAIQFDGTEKGVVFVRDFVNKYSDWIIASLDDWGRSSINTFSSHPSCWLLKKDWILFTDAGLLVMNNENFECNVEIDNTEQEDQYYYVNDYVHAWQFKGTKESFDIIRKNLNRNDAHLFYIEKDSPEESCIKVVYDNEDTDTVRYDMWLISEGGYTSFLLTTNFENLYTKEPRKLK